ncbi:unnamed protein product [Durusdinium trenchii]
MDRSRSPDQRRWSLQLCVSSGSSTTVSLSPSASVGEVKAAAKKFFQHHFLQVTADGTVLSNVSQSIQDAGLHDGQTLTVVLQIPCLAATAGAFALWCRGGGVLT